MIRCRVALIGPMGVGKSTVGRLLAAKLGWPLIDLDHEIESRSGKTISEIFADVKEIGFRQLEFQILQQVTQECEGKCCVLATGGGVVTTPSARSVLSDAWDVVWLFATPKTIVERLQNETSTRPLLRSADDLLTRIEQLSRDREAWYQGVSKWKVDVNDKHPEEVTRQLCQLGGWTECND